MNKVAAIYQIIKYIPLVHHDGDECLELGSLHFTQIPCCLIDQCVE